MGPTCTSFKGLRVGCAMSVDVNALYESVRDRFKSEIGKEVINTLNVVLEVINGRLRENWEKLTRLKEKYRGIKERSIDGLDELVKTAQESLKKVGCEVFLAEKARDAVDYVLSQAGGEEMIVKSKSNTINELGLVEYLKNRGTKVIETDLGDRIIQLTGEIPLHPTGPAIHILVEDIAEAFSREVGSKVEPEADEIMRVAREGLREKILASNVGLTGANVISAEEGSIGLIENEGNISLITRLPKKHIVVAGIDKIVPNLEDAVIVLKTAEAFLTITGAYSSFIKGPSRTADIMGIERFGMHGAKEVHVVLLDDWRTKAMKNGLEEILYCCNCGACLASCPIFRETGRAFTSKVGVGPMGLVRTFFIFGAVDAIESGLFTCTGCGACKEICPGSINFPEIIEKLRSLTIRQGLVLPPHLRIINSILEKSNPFDEPREEKKKWRAHIKGASFY